MFLFCHTAISSSDDDDSDEGTDEEIKSEESDIDEKAEMVCSYDVYLDSANVWNVQNFIFDCLSLPCGETK